MNYRKWLKKILPKKVYNLKHLFLAWYGAYKFDFPSEEIFVIGITGTSGKSSTTYFLRQLLESQGFKVGSLSTIDFYIGGEEQLNDQKMTMLGRYKIQEYLRQMVEKGCDIAIVETTSEGYVQYRHVGINYDMMLLTNLYPEHIDSHGSFENYKNAKRGIFRYVAKRKRKSLKQLKKSTLENVFGKRGEDIPKIAIANGNIEQADEFLEPNFEEKMAFGNGKEKFFVTDQSILREQITDIQSDASGLHFDLNDTRFDVPLYGEHNVLNVALALLVVQRLGADLKKLSEDAKKLKGPQGRLEFIDEAQPYGFQVIVDYAFEPVAMKKLYEVVKTIAPKRILHVFGSTGGGRDVSRRFSVGEYVGQHADICIVTDEDPYDDDPMEIINDVAGAVEKTGKVEGKNLFRILSRQEAIQKVIELSEPGDLLLLTGKGSEQAMVVKGEMVPWDDRQEVRRAIEIFYDKKQ